MNLSHPRSPQNTDGVSGLVPMGMTAHLASHVTGRRVGGPERRVILQRFADSREGGQVLAYLREVGDTAGFPAPWDNLLEFTEVRSTAGSDHG